MLFSYNWLREYIDDLIAPKDLSDRLTMTGTEVESVTGAGSTLTNVVTAQVVKVEQHPNADRLSLCEVRTDREIYQIVCGAKNMKPGDKVALALNGAELPGGLKIKKSKIRGVESQGMMCSEVELGLKDHSEGLLILEPDTALGQDVSVALGLNDFMLEVGITPNRADLLCIKGLAREISAVTGAAMKDKSWQVEEAGPQVSKLASVRIEAGAPCSRYGARVITGLKVAESPEPVKRRLAAHGVRSINNVVDVTNYVLIELGQPMHAFDLSRLEGRKINVRFAEEGETIETIDGKKRELAPSMLVIADGKRPVAIAGIMGGKDTEVTDATTDILLESAYFDPGTVRRASRKLGLSSDSSYRFERGVDIEAVDAALDMAAEMILKLAGGTAAKGKIDVYRDRFNPKPIEFRVKRAGNILGVNLKEDEALDIFERLGLGLKWSADGILSVLPPSYRGDLKGEIDLVEEAARLYGYDRVPTTLPVVRLIPVSENKFSQVRKAVKEVLANVSFLEAVNYSFVSKEMFSLSGPPGRPGVVILNPLTEDQSVMRSSLIPSLLENLRYNIYRKNDQLRIFEFAPVFMANDAQPAQPEERWRVAGLMYGNRWTPTWNYSKEALDFFDIKGIIELVLEAIGIDSFDLAPSRNALFHPGRSAYIMIGGAKTGTFGEIHPDVMAKYDLRSSAYVFDLDMDAILEYAGNAKKYRSLPKFPESTRDIAIIIDEAAPYAEIISSIRRIGTKLIETVELFDVYYGSNIPPGKRSIALRIVYRAADRTLTHQEVEDMHSRISRELTGKFGAEIRGEAGQV